ncbi:MAG: HEAT repeat domain-containing protein [Gemmatimonadales bacterium]
MPRLTKWTVIVAAAMALVPALAAQELVRRVAAVRQGDVEFLYTARAGVCGDGARRLRIGHSTYGDVDDGEFDSFCRPGPVRVRIRMEDGAVSDIHTTVGPRRSRTADAPATELGVVPAAAASAYFIDLARTASGRVAERALLPAVLADSSYPWRALLAIARDSATRDRSTRTNAAFWSSRFAAAKLDGHENDLAAPDDDESPDREHDARGSAVFALSQLRDHEGIPPLIQVARTNHDAYLRRQALFWLGQSGDPRALALFDEILSR